jgi:hypothetical protein
MMELCFNTSIILIYLLSVSLEILENSLEILTISIEILHNSFKF